MGTRRLLLALIVLFGLNWDLCAQVSGYSFSASSGTFDTLVGSTAVPDLIADAGESSKLPIGFTFNYEGVTYDSLIAVSDGFLSFNAAAASTSTNDLDNTAASRRPLIAPLWDDLQGTSSGVASYLTTGTAPNRVFTFEWKRWDFDYYASNPSMSFQVKLYETSNAIEFRYSEEPGALSGSEDASIGLTGLSTFLSLDGAGTAPNASNTTETTSIDAKPVTGQVYTFTPPTCPAPTALAVTSITTSSATLGWAGNGSSFEVKHNAVGSPSTGAGTVISSNSHPVSGLNGGTSYEFYVREICGAGDTSAWAGPFIFATSCVTYTASHSENFDLVAVEAVPNCWSNLVVSASTYPKVETTTSNDLSAPHAIRFYNSYSSSTGDFFGLVSPEYSDLTSQLNRVKFWLRGSSSSSNHDLVVGTITDPTDETTFTPLDTITGISNTYQEYVVNFDAAYTGTDNRIAFKINEDGSGKTLYMDDYVYEAIPSCLEPVSLTASGVSATGATLGWTSQASGTSFEVENVVAGTAPTGSGTIISTNSHAVSGLTPQTDYEFYVREICGAGDSSIWVGPYAYTTLCASIASFPWTDDFSTGLSSCWTVINGGTTDDWEHNSSATYANGTAGGHMEIYTDFNASNDDHLITPGFTLTGNERLKFWTRARSSSEPDELSVLLSTTGVDAADFTTTLMPTTAIDFTTYTEYIIDLSAYTGDVYISFYRGNAPADGWYLYLDDVTVETIPACLEPNAITLTSVASTTVSLAWNSQAGGSSFMVENVTAGTTPTGVGSAVSTNAYTANSLTPDTDYEFYVREVCAPGDSSVWAGPFAYTTPCTPISTFPWTDDFSTGLSSCWTVVDGTTSDEWEHNNTATYARGSAAGHMEIYTDFNSSNDDHLITPPVALTGNERLRFWTRARSAGEPDELSVLLSTTGTSAADFTTTLMPSTAIDYTNYTEYVIDLSAYSGTAYISFYRGNAPADGWYLYLDDVTIETLPSCLEPNTVAATNIGQTTVDLSWASQNGGSDFMISLEPAGTALGTGTQVSGTTYNATGLSTITDYEFYVREICTVGDTSAWTGPFAFTTLCGTYTAPYAENFDAYNSSAVPNCWNIIENGTTTAVDASTTSSNALSAPRSFRLYNSNDNTSTNFIAAITPTFTDLTSQLNRIRFSMRGSSTGTNHDLVIGTITDVTDATTFTPLDTITNIDDTYTEYIRNFDASYTGTDLNIAFRIITDGTYKSIHIDDFHYEAIPLIDVTPVTLAKPVVGCYSSSDTVAVLVENLGSQTIDFSVDTLDVTVNVSGVTVQTLSTEVNSGTLASGASMVVNVETAFDMSAPGLYTFIPFTSMVNDTETYNDTAAIFSRTSVALGTIPTEVDFTGFTGANLNALFPDWNEAEGLTSPSGTTSAWGNSNSTQEAVFGTRTAKINLYTTTRDEWLVGPKFVAGVNDTVFFKLAVTDYNNADPATMGSDDHFDVKISSDCGSTWNTIVTFDQGSNLDTILTEYKVPLDAWAGQEIIVAFFAQDGPTNDPEDYDLHIDDIFIGYNPLNEISVDTILEPTADVCNNEDVNVKVVVTNNGTADQSNINVTVDVAGSMTGSYTGTVAGPLAMGESDTISVGPITMTGTGTLDMTAYTALVGDQLVSNDTAIASVVVNASPVVSMADDSICTGSTTQLDAGAGFTSYNWSNGGQTQILVAAAAGTYTVTVTNVNGCQAIDSAVVSEFAQPSVDFGNDTAYCVGSAFSMTLDATTAGADYQWSDNSTGATLDITSAGTYFVEVSVAGMCFGYDTIVVAENTLPVVDLGNDTLIKDGSALTLDAGTGFRDYLWSDNSTAQTLVVSATSTVNVTVTDNNGCEGTDEITVTIIPVGIEDNVTSQFNLYPNPNAGQFTIVNGGQDTEMNVEVINTNGQVVYRNVANVVSGQQEQVDITNLAKGMYIVNIKSSDKIQQFRMIVQ